MLLTVLIYLIIIIFQVEYTSRTPNYKSEKEIYLDNRVEYNSKNEKKIKNVFYEKINHSVSQLNHNITTDTWINNIKNERYFNVDNNKYYMFVWEKVPEKNNFIYLVSGRKNEDNMSWKDILNNENMKTINTKTTLSKETIPIMYNLSIKGKKNIKNYNYYWLDDFTDCSVLKKSYFKHWKNKDGREGFIGVGMITKNVSTDTSYKYIDYISITKLIITSVIIFIISLLIFSLKTKYYRIKSIGLLLAVNLFLLFFINTTESISTTKNEITKINNINSNILNVSFLSGVNIFIVKTLYETNHALFTETAFVFAMSMILLLLASYKSTNRNRIETIVADRTTNQMVFNTSIFLNSLIILNFILYSLFNKSFQ